MDCNLKPIINNKLSNLQAHDEDFMLKDFFLDPPRYIAKVVLVDSSQATVSRPLGELLDELLCEV